MSENYIQDYIKAGKAVIAAKKLAKKIIKPGMSFLEIANRVEAEIYKNDCELAFPLNMSLNEVAAHYSPLIDDKKLIPEVGLLKIDCGAHYNGYIADSAMTINLDGDPQLNTYITAAEEALEAAIEIFKPGTKLYELGAVIAQKIIEHGLRPITNLGGHELKQYNLHAGPFIPNYKETNHDEILKPGDCYACEPFSTSGVGTVINGKKSYIYRFNKRVKKNLSYELQNYMNKIETITNRLPFSPRLLENQKVIPKDKINRIINAFVRKKILDHYPILIEQSKRFVAQQEHTIIIDFDGNTIVTTKE
ncbi:MAG: type II methionyl aminopeptidase [Promethearchaeota archaeon]|nr:MAG: type II methionyl aminopeptidase [Candidatus Lokiarchaeota archaeon]